jgi:hypothetical protein
VWLRKKTCVLHQTHVTHTLWTSQQMKHVLKNYNAPNSCWKVKRNIKDFLKPGRWPENHSSKYRTPQSCPNFAELIYLYCKITYGKLKCEKSVIWWGSVTYSSRKTKRKKIRIILQTKRLRSKSWLQRVILHHVKKLNVRKKLCDGVIKPKPELLTPK